MKDSRECNLLFMKKLIKDSIGYDSGIKKIARKLSMGDQFLAEELRNEMHIVILSLEEGHEPGYYFRAAKNKAIDYIKSKARNHSYANAIKHVSLDAMEDAGFQIDTERKVYKPDNYSSLDTGDSDDCE